MGALLKIVCTVTLWKELNWNRVKGITAITAIGAVIGWPTALARPTEVSVPSVGKLPRWIAGPRTRDHLTLPESN